MTQHHFGNAGSKAWRRWHEERQQARETAMSASEFGPIETEHFDLDTANITGEENPETYRTEPYGPSEPRDRRDDPLVD
jgi:hypothetical protein